MSEHNIAFSPLNLKENKYVEIMKSFIKLSGYNVVSLNEVLSDKKVFSKTKIFQLLKKNFKIHRSS